MPTASPSAWRGKSPAVPNLVFNWCYHARSMKPSSLFIRMAPPARGAANIGPPVDPAVTTKVIEFNDLPALEHALADGEVACVWPSP